MGLRTKQHEQREADILEAIKAGYSKFFQIGLCTIGCCSKLTSSEIDHALQRLRRNGLIQFDTKQGWTVKEKTNG